MTDHTKQALLDLKAHQQSGSYRLCPRCGKDTMKANLITNALSRHMDIYLRCMRYAGGDSGLHACTIAYRSVGSTLTKTMSKM